MTRVIVENPVMNGSAKPARKVAGSVVAMGIEDVDIV